MVHETDGEPERGGLRDETAETLRIENRATSKKIMSLAWGIELTLVTVGLAIAFAQASGMNMAQAIPVFGVFVILAAVELAKIPFATLVFHGQGRARWLTAVALFVASLISFETVFNGIERFVHATTGPVKEAHGKADAVRAEIARLSDMSLEEETGGEDIAAIDAERLKQLQASLAMREDALVRARLDLESQKTKDLRAQLESLLEQQTEAIRQAGESWQSEQDSIMSRLSGNAIDQATRNQLNARMRNMPAKQNVMDEAGIAYENDIDAVNVAIEESITEPSPQAVANVTRKEAARDKAAADLAAFDREMTERAEARMAVLLDRQATKLERAHRIEELEANLIAAEQEVAHASEASQMHRWASALFGLAPEDVQDHQAKQVGTIFGIFLGFVAAWTGSSVAMVGQWFKVRGVRPVIVTEILEVPVEVIVEKEIEREVEVAVKQFVYVPIPQGDDVGDQIEEILATLPTEAAADLRAQLAASNLSEKPAEKSMENSHARAA